MSNPVTVVGTIATEPRLLTTQSGSTLCSFRLASDERRYDREQQKWVEGETNWFGIVSFRRLATHAADSFAKGDRIVVTGRLRVRSWEQGERRGTSVEIEADALGHDLRWGVSRFEKRVGLIKEAPAHDQQPGDGESDGLRDGEGGRERPGDALVTSEGEASDDGFMPVAA